MYSSSRILPKSSTIRFSPWISHFTCNRPRISSLQLFNGGFTVDVVVCTILSKEEKWIRILLRRTLLQHKTTPTTRQIRANIVELSTFLSYFQWIIELWVYFAFQFLNFFLYNATTSAKTHSTINKHYSTYWTIPPRRLQKDSTKIIPERLNGYWLVVSLVENIFLLLNLLLQRIEK